MKTTIELLQESDYLDKWEQSVNEKGETVHTNDILGIVITMTNLTNEEIEQKFRHKPNIS